MPLKFKNSVYYAFLIKALEITQNGYCARLVTCDSAGMSETLLDVPAKFDKVFIDLFAKRLPVLVKLNNQDNVEPLCRNYKIEDVMIVSPIEASNT